MNNHRLTTKEVAIALEVESVLIAQFPDSFGTELEKDSKGQYTGNEFALCWLIGQRATNIDSRLLYHEGYFIKSNSRMAHAWNTLNGKIIDFAAPVFTGAKGAARFVTFPPKFYKSKHTYSCEDIWDALSKRKGMWNWISDVQNADK
jgi:hypothetical protein